MMDLLNAAAIALINVNRTNLTNDVFLFWDILNRLLS